jgi:hypothetical protein
MPPRKDEIITAINKMKNCLWFMIPPFPVRGL